jgi:succinate-semialdehyde dehydrogenase/glutarate-semialdehyde dehydrogenase
MQLNNTRLLRSQSYIGGRWVDADNGDTLAVLNPANGDVVAHTASLGRAETKRAIDCAQSAFHDWRQRTVKERANLLRRWFDLILANRDDLALILTSEQGKPLAEAAGEVVYGTSYIEWFAEEAKRIYGDVIAPPDNGKRLVVIRQPVGVVAAITPWNFPIAMLTRKIAPALAAGCTIVCKPAHETPLSALALAALAEEAGIPAGVINVVVGKDSHAIGAELTSNPAVRKLTFTGSTRVGKVLLEQCAGTVKKTSMELGGNAPFIVFDDADIDAAVKGAVASKYRNAGQTCICVNRIYVQASIYERFAEKFIAAVRQLRVGNGAEDGVTIGPLINADAVRHVHALIGDAVCKGARTALGGTVSALGECFCEPTVLTNVDATMRIAREEIFGPVAPLFRFGTEQEAVKLANDTEFGLAAYFYSRDIGRIWRIAEALEYGIVGINEGIVSNEMAPFGGVKESGFGREGSKYGIDDYLEIKYLCMGGIEG